ncbi:MAG: hypothetical protein QOI11_1630 [Candidatus Eremiobacteraeota bacterium]|jgi:hypothetical protein|nr:hypothetical protein [Candidatus Eremiobacteraeota bacterium]
MLRRLFLFCSVVAMITAVGCSPGGKPLLTAPPKASGEQLIVLGGSEPEGKQTVGDYAIAVDDGAGTNGRVYHVAAGTRLVRHVSRSLGEYVEAHGTDGALFLPAAHIVRISQVTSGGLREVSVSKLPFHRGPQSCTYQPLAHERAPATVTCDDPGPCPDCTGPMAPGGFLACHITRACGGDPDIGTGFGVGIFRSVLPQLSCYFDFTDSSYDCNLDTANTESAAPQNLSAGYEYNAAMGSALLHCLGPSRKSEAFVSGKTPDGTIALGFHIVQAGRAVAHAMRTPWTYNTLMNAQYFGTGAFNIPISYVGWCAGAN